MVNVIGMECMLHLIAQLRKDGIGNIGRIMGDKEDTYTFGTDQLNDLLDLIQESSGNIFEEKMCFIKEEDNLRLVQITDFRQFLIELVQVVELPPFAVEEVDDDGAEVQQHPDARVRALDVMGSDAVRLQPELDLIRQRADLRAG